jgi:diguanylate cyclase (GGDEF)-like protein
MIDKFRQYAFITVFIITGLVMLFSAIYSINIAHKVADIHAPLVDAAVELKLELALSHLKFEEAISGHENITMDEVTSHIAEAKWYAHAMLSGGKNSEGEFIAIEDIGLRDQIIITAEKISQLEDWVQVGLSGIKGALPQNEVDHDALFEEALKEADSVKNILLAILTKERSLQRLTNYMGLALLITLFVIVSIYFISRRRVELELINRLTEEALYDELTGIHNRRSFNSTLSNDWNHSLRAQGTLSLVICDIDFFKRYNDTLGHLAGDECLKSIAEVMQSMLQRPIDSIARYGGEEFAFIFPFTDAIGAVKMIDKLQNKLSIKKVSHPDSDVSDYVTISAGIASLTPSSKYSIEELISVADKALYRAKKEGRNRICYDVLS